MSKKQPNRLALLIDHQAFAGSALPKNLADDLNLYLQATDELKKLLVGCLPDEIISTLWVVGLTTDQLTLSVGSHTAANHIRYLQNAYLQVLTAQSITFKQLKQIHTVVAKDLTNNTNIVKSLSAKTTLLKHPEVSHNRPLSQNTKRTISQAAEHVTTDKNLQKAILRLIND